MTDHESFVLDATTKIVSAYLGHGPDIHDMGDALRLTKEVYCLLFGLTSPGLTIQSTTPQFDELWRKASAARSSHLGLELEPAPAPRKEPPPGMVMCLECGQSMKMLKRHLLAAHNLDVEGYLARHRLPKTTPLVSPEYSAKRSALAKEHGLGLTGHQRAAALARR